GIEAARRIRAQGTPVVYLTAYASILRDADGGEVDGPYLSKPFGTQELNSTIVRTLGTSPPPR
ncbi:MAG TPA: hypothetical protein VEQ63_01835, partial [Bryobacteraceae bacterium]|nr:hypothetical protein [Bryobacteraceae bacterium]